jgi:hypothetical protein
LGQRYVLDSESQYQLAAAAEPDHLYQLPDDLSEPSSALYSVILAHNLYPPDYSSKEGDLLVRLQPVCLVDVILLQLRHLFVRCTPNLGFSLLQLALLFQSQGRSVGWVPLYILLHISWRSCLERVAGILVRRQYVTGHFMQ